MNFKTWLTVFLDEKGIDLETILMVDGPSGPNAIPVACLMDMIKQAPAFERAAIKNMLVRIDFKNGDVLDYFRHLAKAIAV